jgi:malonyl CoA-acyl carrier protein transacylase/acyl carrier protein
MPKIAHIFPGQGAFFAGPLRHARLASIEVADTLDCIETVAQRRLGRSLIEVMWDERHDAAHLLKSDPAMLQLAIFTVSVAAHALLRSRKVEPDVLIGHSFGEIAALTSAGVYSIQQGAEIVCDRVECLAAAAPPDGCMAAVSAGPDIVAGMIAEWAAGRPSVPAASRLAVAVENHETQTVISGPAAEVAAFVLHCKTRKLSAQTLHSPYGFHHPALAPVTAAFAARLRGYAHSVPQRPVYSPILGRYYRQDDAFGDCLSRHLVLPVAFSKAVRQLRADGVSVFIECGALDGVTRIVSRILGPDGAKTFPTFTPATVEDGGCGAIVAFMKEHRPMNAPVPSAAFPEFEEFWRERSPFILALIRSEFVSFLMQQRHIQWMPVGMTASTPLVPPVTPPPPQPAMAQPVSPPRREKLFSEIVGIYAEAMEYPTEVFTETVELEAELGIDSVKQAEIMGRLSETYELPRLPANVRLSDFKTVGQVVDLVFANHGKAAVAA